MLDPDVVLRVDCGPQGPRSGSRGSIFLWRTDGHEGFVALGVLKGSFVALGVLKGSFVALGVMKGSFVALGVMKGSFVALGVLKGSFVPLSQTFGGAGRRAWSKSRTAARFVIFRLCRKLCGFAFPVTKTN